MVRLASFVFQACSIDHSDISPFRINDLRAAWNSVAQNPPSRISIRHVLSFQSFADRRVAGETGIVSDLLISHDHLRRSGRVGDAIKTSADLQLVRAGLRRARSFEPGLSLGVQAQASARAQRAAHDRLSQAHGGSPQGDDRRGSAGTSLLI